MPAVPWQISSSGGASDGQIFRRCALSAVATRGPVDGRRDNAVRHLFNYSAHRQMSLIQKHLQVDWLMNGHGTNIVFY
jgi:hypothetical protein